MKFMKIVLQFLLALSALPAALVFAETVENKQCTMAAVYIEEGNKLIQDNPAKAEVLYRKAVEHCPESGNASFDLGVSLYNQKKNSEAIKILQGILSKYPDRTDVLRMLAYILVKEKVDPEKGMVLAEKILAANPKDEAARKILTIALTEPVLPGPSLASQEKVVVKKQPPAVLQAEANRQMQKAAREKTEEAITPLLREGKEAYKRGNADAAVVSFRKILNIDPENREAREYLGKVDVKKIKAAVDKEIEKYYLNGVGLYIDGKYKEAIDSWKQVLELDPKYEKASLNIEKAKRKMEGVMDTK